MIISKSEHKEFRACSQVTDDPATDSALLIWCMNALLILHMYVMFFIAIDFQTHNT